MTWGNWWWEKLELQEETHPSTAQKTCTLRIKAAFLVWGEKLHRATRHWHPKGYIANELMKTKWKTDNLRFWLLLKRIRKDSLKWVWELVFWWRYVCDRGLTTLTKTTASPSLVAVLFCRILMWICPSQKQQLFSKADLVPLFFIQLYHMCCLRKH